MRTLISIVLISIIVLICDYSFAKEAIRGESLSDKYRQEVNGKNIETRQMIDELKMSLMNLPDKYDDNGWARIDSYVYILGKRGAVEARGIFERYIIEIRKIEEEESEYVRYMKRINYRSTAYRTLSSSLLRLEIAEKGNIKDEIQLRILLNKLEMELKRLDMDFKERGKDPVVVGPIIEVICDLPPDLLIPEMFKLLDGDNERLKQFVLSILGKTGFGGEQKRVIDFMEAEINKPGYGLYFSGQANLGQAGDAEAYRYLKEKLKSPDPVIRENTITAIGQFYDRKIIDVDEFQSTLTPLLKDEDKNVSEKATSMLRLNDFIKPHK